ncbi:MAG TPA: hypothetical protein VGO22_17610 [Pseudorhizobium sp.]|nr:hypothetical protein [Pseudorhizobium sp.]
MLKLALRIKRDPLPSVASVFGDFIEGSSDCCRDLLLIQEKHRIEHSRSGWLFRRGELREPFLADASLAQCRRNCDDLIPESMAF